MRRLACLGLCSVMSGVACASPTFTVNTMDDMDGGSDAHGGHDASSPSSDAGHDARADGGGLLDASKLPDAEGTDAQGADGEGAKDAGGGKDVEGAEDSGEHDAGMPDVMTTGGTDSGSLDAGPACATKTTNDNIGIYVVVNGATSGMCTRFGPCASVAIAMGTATAAGYYTIYVGPGMYAASSSTAIKDGITISGGWNVDSATNAWTGSCNAADTPTLTAPNTVLTVGSPAAPSTGAVTIDTLNVQNNATASAGSAASFYGIFAVGSGVSSLTLNDVGITSPAAGSGPNGDMGAMGATGLSGGCAETTVGGAAGAAGAAGPAGRYDSSGFTPAPTDVNRGNLGEEGTTPASVTNTAESDTCTLDTAGTGCASPTEALVSTAPTLSGCGGVSGGGGGSGGSGGSSVALYLWNEPTTVRAGVFVAGSGGSGGTGGAGGAGGSGAAGGQVAASVPYDIGCSLHVLDPGTGNQHDVCSGVTASLPGLTGDPGGTGGTGGQGGGGAGGDSYSYYSNVLSSVTVLGGPIFTHGAAASGGSPNGPPGNAATHN